jgi:hypothetical protein
MSSLSPKGGVHCKSRVKKLGFLHGSIITNDDCMILTIEGKWLEAIMHVTKFEFLDLPCPKQVELFISCCIQCK